MKRLVSICLAAALALCGTAAAQSANPVMQHYRAYQAALEANDLTTAEREAAEALAASEARSGDGGNTAVLALNLASVRFLNNNAAAAVEPGRRALSIAQSAGEERSGVSPVLAQLIVGRAELAAGDTSAAERLGSGLVSAQDAHIAPAEIYDAATELGAWAFQNQRYEDAGRAWSVAAAYAEGSRFGAPYARGQALTGEAASMLLANLQGRRRGARLDDDVARDAYDRLNRAVADLRPLAERNTDGAITYAQRSYANALAWRAVLHAKLSSDRQSIPQEAEAQGDADGLSEVDIAPSYAEQPRCLVRVIPRGEGYQLYPSEAVEDGRLAGVAVRFRIGARGQVEESEAIAVIGDESFARAVEHARDWRVQRREDSPPNCRMAMSVIQSISFTMQ
jgi:DNA-binding transcriptional regulator YdaS (Cro superfamily)